MRRVWVPKQSGHDLSTAEQYGKLHTVFDEAFSPFMMERAVERATVVFDETPPTEEDYVLFSGPTSLNLITVMEILRRVPSVRCLIFHARDRKYVVRDLFAKPFKSVAQETARGQEESDDGAGAGT